MNVLKIHSTAIVETKCQPDAKASEITIRSEAALSSPTRVTMLGDKVKVIQKENTVSVQVKTNDEYDDNLMHVTVYSGDNQPVEIETDPNPYCPQCGKLGGTHELFNRRFHKPCLHEFREELEKYIETTERKTDPNQTDLTMD